MSNNQKNDAKHIDDLQKKATLAQKSYESKQRLNYSESGLKIAKKSADDAQKKVDDAQKKYNNEWGFNGWRNKK